MYKNVVCSCLWTVLHFCLAAITGALVTYFIFQYIHPPGGPNYGDGIGYGMAMIFNMVMYGFFSGVIGALVGVFARAFYLKNKEKLDLN